MQVGLDRLPTQHIQFSALEGSWGHAVSQKGATLGIDILKPMLISWVLPPPPGTSLPLWGFRSHTHQLGGRGAGASQEGTQGVCGVVD